MKWSRYNLYMPDVNSAEILVFNTLWRNLFKLQLPQGQSFDPNCSPELYADDECLGQLREIGTIVEDNIDERLLFQSIANQSRFDKTILSVFVSFASTCNFACGYCYESYKDNPANPSASKMLNQDMWTRLLFFLRERIQKNSIKNLSIVFFGGEPLMNYEIVLKAAQDLHALASSTTKVSLSLITNGSLLSSERIDDLHEYFDLVQITLDGYKSDHDKRRPYKNGNGSFEEIYKNLCSAVQVMGPKIALRINIDKGNCARIVELLSLLHSEGYSGKIGSVSFSQVFPTQNEIENVSSFLDNPNNSLVMIDDLMELQRRAIEMGFRIPKDYIDGPCSISSPNSFAVDEQLKVYKCPGYLYQNPIGFINESGKMIVNNNFWYECINLPANCAADCVYGPICYGGCRWQAGGLNGVKCHKHIHDHFLKERIKIYAESLRRVKNT